MVMWGMKVLALYHPVAKELSSWMLELSMGRFVISRRNQILEKIDGVHSCSK